MKEIFIFICGFMLGGFGSTFAFCIAGAARLSQKVQKDREGFK